MNQLEASWPMNFRGDTLETFGHFLSMSCTCFSTRIATDRHTSLKPANMAKKQKTDGELSRPTRDDSAKFMCTPEEKAAYERAGVLTDFGMSGWIRRTLKAELDRLGISVEK